MPSRIDSVEALAALPRIADPTEQRATWRRAVAALGRLLRVDGPPPLDRLAPEQLVAAAKTALGRGLADELDWIAPGAAAVALYELTSALPHGSPERRDFGRRVLSRLYEGDASTFAAAATRMAMLNAKPLEAATMAARIGLVLDLPMGTEVHADALAYVLVTRRELFETWLLGPSTGTLPARRLCALTVERAAREGVRRFMEGDPHPRLIFRSDPILPLMRQLLADREPLVWRHAAVARGLLSSIDPLHRENVEESLDPSLDPGNWRRAAVSLVAAMTNDPTTGLKHCRGLLKGEIPKRDPGVTATMIWGLPRVVEAEPDAAEELLELLCASRRPDVAEAVAMLLRERARPEFGRRAAELAMDSLRSATGTEHQALLATFDAALANPDDPNSDTGVFGSVRRALVAFEVRGAKEAHIAAVEALGAANRVMDGVSALSAHGEADDPDLLALLMDLDAGVLERARLAHLLLLARRPGDTDATVPELRAFHNRVGSWLVDQEARAERTQATDGMVVARQRRLKALLHLLDTESEPHAEADAVVERSQELARRATRVLIESISAGGDVRVHRISCAALARSFDALVREGVADASDVFLVVARRVTDSDGVAAIAAGSTNPDVTLALESHARFLRAVAPGAVESLALGSFDPAAFSRDIRRGEEIRVARGLIELSQGLGAGGSYRGEAVRHVVLHLGRALEAIASARSLRDLVDPGGAYDPLGELEDTIDSFRRLETAAERRVLSDDDANIDVVADVARLAVLVARTVTSGVPPNAKQIGMAIGELTRALPDSIAAAAAEVLVRVDGLPVETPQDEALAIPLQQQRAALPDWMLPRRVVGAFYVVRPLGAGGGASVFVARRVEERRDPTAESFALKVPEYDPSTARSLSEQEFFDLFRSEAGALLGLPSHPNLARFVTFDLSARPKPILVMELIKGTSLDRALRNRALTTDLVFTYLDGILAGLEAMHGAGVGHLDMKPSNVIVRPDATPVLVDFGLSGRHLRPGCGTLEYTAPEILGIVPEGHEPVPMDADVYAFACTAFELLTGVILLDADDEMALVTKHIQHDGWPEALADLAEEPHLTDLARVFAACLRRDPRNRPGVTDVREMLSGVAPALRDHPWPLRARRSSNPHLRA